MEITNQSIAWLVIIFSLLILALMYRYLYLAEKRKEENIKFSESNRDFDKLDLFKDSVGAFIKKMEDIPDWHQVVQKRGDGHAMFAKDMGIKVDDYEYWANAHKEEYLIKYNDGNLDIEGIKLRIEKFGYIVSELEKVIKKGAEFKLNITTEMHNDYCAARASVLGAEYALKEISLNPTTEESKTFKRESDDSEIITKKEKSKVKYNIMSDSKIEEWKDALKEFAEDDYNWKAEECEFEITAVVRSFGNDGRCLGMDVQISNDGQTYFNSDFLEDIACGLDSKSRELFEIINGSIGEDPLIDEGVYHVGYGNSLEETAKFLAEMKEYDYNDLDESEKNDFVFFNANK